jgi:hypothetical protein
MTSNGFNLSDIISSMKYTASYGSNPVNTIAEVSLTSSQINNLELGSNSIQITNSALLNHLRNINSSPVQIDFNIDYKTYSLEDSSAGGPPGTYPPAVANAGAITTYSPTTITDSDYIYYGIAVDSNNVYYVTATDIATNSIFYLIVYTQVPWGPVTLTTQTNILNLSPYTFNTGIFAVSSTEVVNNVAVDSNNNCYIAATNCVIQVVNPLVATNTPSITSYSGTSGISNISLQGIAIDMNNNIYVTDSGNNQVIKLYSPNYTTNIVSPSSLVPSPFSPAGLFNPAGIAVDKVGQVCVCDSQINNNGGYTGRIVLLFMQDLTYITTYGGTSGNYDLYGPTNIAIDINNVHCIYSNTSSGSIAYYDTNFNLLNQTQQLNSGSAAAMAVDANGRLVVMGN